MFAENVFFWVLKFKTSETKIILKTIYLSYFYKLLWLFYVEILDKLSWKLESNDITHNFI